jgi:hypothetical protein
MVFHCFRFTFKFLLTIGWLVAVLPSSFSFSNYETPLTDTPSTQKDTLKFPIEDRKTDKLLHKAAATFDLKDPANIKTEIEYDPVQRLYSITERVGKEYYRAPSYMTFEEFLKYQFGKDEEAYFRKRANTITQITKKGGTVPKVNLGNAIFDRIFGGSTIEMKPHGNIDMFFGGNWQHVKNPMMVLSAQRYGIFDFDMNMNVNLLAKVGDKFRTNFNYIPAPPLTLKIN